VVKYPKFPHRVLLAKLNVSIFANARPVGVLLYLSILLAKLSNQKRKILSKLKIVAFATRGKRLYAKKKSSVIA
jgi:hypothetical protein